MTFSSSRRRPDLRRGLLGLCAAVLLVVGAGLPASAGRTQAPPTPGTPTPTTDEDGESAPVDEPAGLVPPLYAGLQELAVSSPKFDAAEERLEAANRELVRIREIGANAARDRRQLERREVVLTRQVEAAQRQVASFSRQVRRLRGELRNLAVASYVSGRELKGFGALVEVDAHRHNDLRSQAVMVDTVNADLTDTLRVKSDALAAARTEVTLTMATRTGIRARIREVKEVQAEAGAAEERAGQRVLLGIAQVETWRRLAEVDGTDIPLVVLDAYLKAAQIAALVTPDCGIPWWALAGIGRTESHHGSSGGAQVRADGSLTKPILGIPLDGSGETASINAGDGTPDRAQGPMQFITSTWERWGRDGNGDTFVEVQNMYDAAAAAAAYLCASGPMRTDADLRRGYFSYNHSGPYVDAVLERARAYEAAVELPTPD